MSDEAEKVKVAIRVRPFNKRETDLGAQCSVSMYDDQITLTHPNGEKQPRTFAFDHCFDSIDPRKSNFVDQEEVFTHLGAGVLNNAFSGYNACIFAYGQTGSGKSYSMMGTSDNPGIIPRLCCAIFQRIKDVTCESLSFKVEVSYMEIYNERVRDLLDPKKSNKNLKVREHKILGPMVDGLSELAVSSYEQILSLIEEGNKSRTVAATNMNAESSRSHAVFNIRITQVLTDVTNGFIGEKVSKISLVDLAGSERAEKSGAVGKRLTEGGNINKSLTTLGMVISSLAENSRGQGKTKFVPYRDSVLTWILKDNLGGNSKTVMIATVSPSVDNYEETLSTLRYADRAKKIVNHAVVNEDPNAKMIRELKEEVEMLRSQITQTIKEHNETEELRERLAESERIIEQMNKSWDERLRDTEMIYKERQRHLSEIGISVAGGGIKMENDRFYLVNLNSDPSLNELLVYYINERTVIGCNDQADTTNTESSSHKKVDIVLQGLGVRDRHALLELTEVDGCQRLFIEPLDAEARVLVNGRNITQRTALVNGNRIVIGNNHYFRVNCPKTESDMNSSVMEESVVFDYEDAWHEANTDGNANPMTSAVDQYMEQITKKHEEEKQAALESQYEAFERYIQGLTQSFTPSTPMTPMTGFITPIATPGTQYPAFGFPLNPKPSIRSRFFKWAQRREERFNECLSRLKKDIIRANALVREANMIAVELSKHQLKTTYDVTLQIPASNLRPSKIKAGAFVCEPFIVVKRKGIAGHQLWTVSQLENKLVDMREMYNDKLNGLKREEASKAPDSRSIPHGMSPAHPSSDSIEDTSSLRPSIDPFFDSQENHTLIGVANVFLEVLFHDIHLHYQVPIISQQGEVCGRLHVEIYRIDESPFNSMISSTDSFDLNRSLEAQGIGSSFLGQTIKCRVRIKKASNLPLSLSHFVFCQYSFFNISELLVVAPVFDPNSVPSNQVHSPHSTNFQFEHEKDFSVYVTEEFLEYVQEDALSIEVWGHRSSGLDSDLQSSISVFSTGIDYEEQIKTLKERWNEVTRRLELRIAIKELNDDGEYGFVEIKPTPEILTGGVFQLKQGQQRRIVAEVKLLPEHGNLPMAFTCISSVSIGCICSRSADVQKPLDSYQEEDLDRIREKWTMALGYRQSYLEHQINSLSAKGSAKTESEVEREQSLIKQRVALTEERNAISVPALNSGLPGALSDWDPPAGYEKHVPVVFLDINPDEMAEEIPPEDGSVRVAGMYTFLPKECCGQFVMLPVVDRKSSDMELSTTCSWDSSIHEHSGLNKPSRANERIYAIVKVVVRLSHPCETDLVLRKRICVNVYKRASLTDRLFKRIVGTESTSGTSVYYDVVAHIPKSSMDVEDRSTLAMIAAQHISSEEDSEMDKDDGRRTENYIETYTKCIQTVESMLKLDRLRQEVAINNLLNKQDRSAKSSHSYNPIQEFRMKRAVSLPNTNMLVPNITNTETHCGEASGSRRSMAMSTTSSGTSSMVTSLVSPIVESSRLHGIDEEHHYSGRCLDNMSKSSTIPETMHSSTQSQFPLLMARQSCGMSNRFEDSLKNYEKGFDKNGNADCDSPLLGNTGISSLLASSRLMSSSLASDSGCMVDSGSSLATTDEERKNFSVEDITVMNSNESIEKLDSNLVRKGSALEMNIARV